MGTGWDDLELTADPAQPGCFTTQVSDPWMLAVVPQGGIVAAIAVRAMQAVLDDPAQTLRTITSVFAGQVAAGPVEVDVQVLRRGRSMSQLTATVRNPGAVAGLTCLAVFGGPRRGFSFTELGFPAVEPPDGLRGFRDPLPEGVEFEFARPPMPFWDEVIECRPAIGRPPWEPFDDRPAEVANWYRLDHPPTLADGSLDPVAALVLCDTMPGSVGQKVPPEAGLWFGPSVDLTVHLLAPASTGWLLAHGRARHAGDGYASVDLALWDPAPAASPAPVAAPAPGPELGPDGTGGPRLVAYATQLMFFAFGV